MADWLDSLNIPDRVRNRMLGHTNKEKNSAGEYGGKGAVLVREQAGFVMALETPNIRRIRTILVGAKEKANAGILTTIDPFAAEVEEECRLSTSELSGKTQRSS